MRSAALYLGVNHFTVSVLDSLSQGTGSHLL